MTTSTVGETGTASQTNTNSILILITVTLNKAKRAEDAANAFAEVIQGADDVELRTCVARRSTSSETPASRPGSAPSRGRSSLDAVLARSTLKPLDKLVLVSELEQAQASLGQTIDSQTTNQQDLILARDVETHPDRSRRRPGR